MKKFIILLWIASQFSFACMSDADCNLGYQCLKNMYDWEGQCIKAVDEFGIQNFNEPRNNYGPKIESGCNFDTDCPLGFKCDSYSKECVR